MVVSKGKILVALIGVCGMVAGAMMAYRVPLAVRTIDRIRPTPVVLSSTYTSTPTFLVSTVVSLALPTVTPFPTNTVVLPTTTGYIESCASVPVNLSDGVTVNLSQNKWYVIDDYNNRIEIPEHHVIVVRGPGTVTAVPERGQRAWECPNQATAQFVAEQTAIFIKRSNPTNKVYGPDGQEITGS
jgi:hypothetical protein